MPLTEVVHYLNQHLPKQHPQAALGRHSRFVYSHGRIGAQVAGFTLIPYQLALVYATPRGYPLFGRFGHFMIETGHGGWMHPESIYIHATDVDDIVFLDRFLRTLHTLYHLNQTRDRREYLALAVHLRHVGAVQDQHGLIFEALLQKLGMAPGQIILKLPTASLQQDPHVRYAAQNFVARGYHLAAAGLPDELDVSLLARLGVGWVCVDKDTLARTAQESASPWAQLHAHSVRLWVTQVTDRAVFRWARAYPESVLEGRLDELNPEGLGQFVASYLSEPSPRYLAQWMRPPGAASP
ncbi:hypothetical protein [Thiorhodospira sibirica]|uniref:hypothetical protein n=1 Tax=Thiorhodospira sibirica TaxID=154347 RepID=UPI00022C3FFF|nr:hypothetical protein [Thiorhodospira sibirica]